MQRLFQMLQHARGGLMALVLVAGLQGCAGMLPQQNPVADEAKPEAAEVKKPLAPKTVDAKTVRQIRKLNKAVTLMDATAYADFINEASREFQIDNQLLVALISVESMFNIEAASQAGAKGLTQVIPRYHREKIAHAKLKFKLYSIFEPRLNIYVGAWVLRDYMDNSKNVQVALQKYNGSLDDPSQTYANRVFAVYHSLKASGTRSQ